MMWPALNLCSTYDDFPDERGFPLLVGDESMAPDYRPGDVVMLSPAALCQWGDPAFVRLRNGEATFRRPCIRKDGRVSLKPTNRAYPTRLVEHADIYNAIKAVWMSRWMIPAKNKAVVRLASPTADAHANLLLTQGERGVRWFPCGHCRINVFSSRDELLEHLPACKARTENQPEGGA